MIEKDKSEIVSIILIDDHQMVLEGMKAILAQIAHIEVAATAPNAFEAIKILRENQTIMLAFVDINLPDISGIELCGKIKTEFPKVQVIALSTFNQRSYVAEMISKGASGYLVKSADKEEIEQAINTVMKGMMYFSADINNNPISKNVTENGAPILTRREVEILKLIALGMKGNEIADKLFLSHFTVATHRKNLMTKFEVGNTALLISKANDYGIL
jgi:two-component system, NarL family, nitrate/nitrite response regulator NarL